MTFDKNGHHRRSIRLKQYDYSQPGAYFVTICTKNRECMFGNIDDSTMILNDAGHMIERWWQELPRKFPMIDMDAHMIMPNHVHGIIAIVGAALCGRPDGPDQTDEGQPHRVAPTLGTMIDWFKTMTTNDYIRSVRQHQWHAFPGKLWQRNYYEHVIRNERDLNAVREYIVNNPAGWDKDEENPAVVGAGFKPAPTPSTRNECHE